MIFLILFIVLLLFVVIDRRHVEDIVAEIAQQVAAICADERRLASNLSSIPVYSCPYRFERG